MTRVDPAPEQPAAARPLSHAQRMIWAGQQFHPDVPLYNMAFAFTIRGDLDAGALAAAFGDVVAASDTMRTVFRERDGRPERLVLPEIDADVPLLELDGSAARNLLEQRARAHLDPTRRLFESALIRVAPGEHVWFLNQHHLIADAWAMALTFRDVAAAYRARRVGTPPPAARPSYEQLVAAEHGDRGAARARAHWTAKVAAAAAPPSLYGSARRHPSTEAARVVRVLDQDRYAALRDLAARPELAGVTPDISLFNLFATLLTAWMWRVSGQDRLGLGCVAHNRVTPASKQTGGIFIELFPLLVEVGDDSFASLNAKVGAESLRLLQHAHSGASMPEFARTFNVVLNFITATLGDFAGLPVTTEWLHSGHGDPGHHLRLETHDLDGTGELVLNFDFNREVFDAPGREAAVEHFCALLDALSADPAQAIAAVDLAGRPEPGRDDPERAATATVTDLFAAQVRRHGDRTAVTASDGGLSYAELARSANRLARRLQRAGAGPGTVVGLATEPSVDTIVGIVAILEAGAAYLPLDMADPPERWHRLLAASGAGAVLGHAATAERLAGTGVPALRIDDRTTQGLDPDGAPVAGVQPGQLACIALTPDGTGTAQPVMLEHRNLVAAAAGLHERIDADPADPGRRVALLAPPGSAASVRAIFGSLLGGHSLHVVPPAVRLDGDRLADHLAAHGIDVVDATPAHLRLLLGARDGDLRDLPLRLVVCGGDALSPELAARFAAACGERPPVLITVYGMAESSASGLSWQADAPDARPGRPTIGTPLPGVRARILGDRGLEQPAGVVGELCLGGAGLARGYLGDPARTAASFVPDPFEPGARLLRTGDLARRAADGTVELVGRRDRLVEVGGNVADLVEIETALRSFGSDGTGGPDRAVHEVAVVARHDATGDASELCAYYVAGAPLPPQELRAFLGRTLPDYMIPARFVQLDELPLTPAGRVDRAELVADGGSPEPRQTTAAPMTAAERALAGIWAEVLGVDDVGVHDSFFELGGDSIDAIQIVARARRHGLVITSTQLFDTLSVGALAAVASAAAPEEETGRVAPAAALDDADLARLSELLR